MDSNTITFHMIPSNVMKFSTSPEMRDEKDENKFKLISQESTRFIQYQQFKFVSTTSETTVSDDSLTVEKIPAPIFKTKIIQKQNKEIKHTKNSQKQSKNQHSRNQDHPKLKSSTNQNSNLKNVLNNKTKSSQNAQQINSTKKTPIAKSHSFVSIFDWMMEIASVIKITRSAFYRACNIFYECFKKDQNILMNSNVEKYACASLLISAKFQKSTIDYLHQIQQINKKRISRQVITSTEITIYQLLNWKIPILNFISEQVIQVFTKWNNYLQKSCKIGIIKRQTCQKLRLNLQYNQSQPLKNKVYGEILYLTDIIVFNQAKKYMNSTVYESQSLSYITPIAMAIYSVLTIQLGDTENRCKYIFPLFKNFYREELDRQAHQIDRLQKQIDICFMIYGLSEQISKIPLTKDWKQIIRQDLQTYLPVNVLKKGQAK